MFLILACAMIAFAIGVLLGGLLICAIVINSMREIDYSSLYEKDDVEFNDDLNDENDESGTTQE